MKLRIILIIGLLLLSCDSGIKIDKANVTPDEKVIKKTDSSSTFNFEEFQIFKGKLGRIHIGMTVSDAELQVNNLTRKVDEAGNFGYGGGGLAYLYYSGDDLLFGLIPKYMTDTVLSIVVIHNKLRTSNGLSPASTVKELINEYPDFLIAKDLMNDYEIFTDEANGWSFIFMTDEDTEIGEYPDVELPTKPKRVETKADWITIH